MQNHRRLSFVGRRQKDERQTMQDIQGGNLLITRRKSPRKRSFSFAYPNTMLSLYCVPLFVVVYGSVAAPHCGIYLKLRGRILNKLSSKRTGQILLKLMKHGITQLYTARKQERNFGHRYFIFTKSCFFFNF